MTTGVWNLIRPAVRLAAREPASPRPPATPPAVRLSARADSFSPAASPAGSPSGPPPLPGRTEAAWQRYCEQFRGPAQAELARKRASAFPDREVHRLIHAGGGPVYVGHWSTAPGKEDTPLFFQNFPSDRSPRAQLYTFPHEGKWVSFEVAHDFFKAYNSASYMGGPIGTSSPLGFPNSGSEFVGRGAQWPFFVNDPEVAARIDARGNVNFQAFERGYLVSLGDGRVQAFDLDGRRLGANFPDGRIDGQPVQPPPPPPGGIVPTPGTNARGVYRTVFQTYDVAPGVSVPSRVGVHWGPQTAYSNVERINAVADQLKAHGVGFATIIVNCNDVQAQAPSIRALLDRGIQPVVRLLPSGDYNKTMDQCSPAELEQLANAARTLQAMGVKLVQLDNEPNWEEGGKRLYGLLNSTNPPGQNPAYKAAMDAYVGNTKRAMELIAERAPGLAIGFGGFSPNKPGGQQMWQDLMYGLRYWNNESGGQLLKTAFVAVHPYSTGGPNEGVNYAQWELDSARAILGFDIKTLATEGGNPTDRPDQAQASSNICQEELRRMGRNPNATQCFWLIGDYYLLGRTGAPEGWENHALIDQNGQGSIFWGKLDQIAHGQIIS